MSITEQTEDSFKTDVFSNLPYPLYMYYLDVSLFSNSVGDMDNLIPLTMSNSIISVQLNPYIEADDFHLQQIPYDKDRFKYMESGAQLGLGDDVNPLVYRIKSMKVGGNLQQIVKTKELGEFYAYYRKNVDTNNRDWRNESKLYNYPYSFAYLYDGLGEPFEVKYHLCKKNLNKIKVRIVNNMNSDYKLFIQDYKDEFDGLLEGWKVSTNKELPCSSNAYASWLATNKNQMQANITTNQFQTFQRNQLSNSLIPLQMMGGLIGGGVSALSGNVMGGLAQATGAIGSGIMQGAINNIQTQGNMRIDKQVMVQQQLAQQRDMMNMPNTLISKGGDFLMSYGEMEGGTLKLIRYRQPDYVMKKLGDYFAMYGYKQNRILDITNLRTRYYYNYIKTVGVNIKANNIPKSHIEEIKKIFDKGVTFWHIDREGVIVGDYSKDNKEV